LWAAYGIVGAGVGIIGAITLAAGKSKAENIKLMPEEAVTSIKENIQWIKNRI
jgi:hypothetical protein